MVAAAPEIDELFFALAFAGVGALVGRGVAAFRQQRNPDANTTRIIFCWSAAGFVLGWLILLYLVRF